jgi:hypothetical protein
MGRKSGRLLGAELWEELFEQWRQSGMVQGTFYLEEYLRFYAFYDWYRKLILNHELKKMSVEAKQLRLPLAEVVVVERAMACLLESTVPSQSLSQTARPLVGGLVR